MGKQNVGLRLSSSSFVSRGEILRLCGRRSGCMLLFSGPLCYTMFVLGSWLEEEEEEEK